jgi:hypothetical protein
MEDEAMNSTLPTHSPRLGFASLTIDELRIATSRLATALEMM